ncbi:hypothetical protein MKW94_026062 [Papaver nudicaule]|uniref:H15 domain-containing protein n=1 Tax=Papaver nudicaule TaxID=74823 RepID=A0AA41S219_PAPNU|nr:hypothetical protein [Papaver nudicaule]
MENMVPFFPPPPQFAAAQPLPTAAPPPLTTQTPPPLQQPQVVIPPAPLGFMPPPQTNLAELQHITPPQQVVIPPAPTPLKQSPNSHNNHPPYAEMIITAIKALNEITGSSKIAIAKFIGATYTNLPPNHSALLSHHLKRLKDNGLIITIKNSYTLPSLINLNNPLSPPSASAPGAADSTTPKRGRGRPPKTNTTSTPGPSPSPNPDLSSETTIVGEVQGRSEEVVLPAKRGRGRPPGSIAKPKAISKPKPKPKPIVVGGGGGSRGRGRPRKVTSDAFGSGPSGPPAQLAGLVPGMVILPATNENIVVNGGAAATTVVSTAPTVDVPTVASTTPAAGSGRPVGRPKKVNVESSTVVPVANGVAVVKPVGSGRSVGRPKKVGAVGRPRKVVGSVGRPKRTVGRPAKFGGGGGVVKKTAAVSTGRPAGRPRKVGNNIKDRVVTLLEESLGLGMNQSVPDMYLRFTQLYNIITGKDYDIALAGATAQGNNQ